MITVGRLQGSRARV